MKKFYQTLGLGMMILTTSAGASSPGFDLSETQGISRPPSAVTLPVTPFISNLHNKSESEGPKLSQPHNRTSNMPYDVMQKGAIELDSQSSTDPSHRLHTLLPLSCVQDISHLSLDPATHQAIVYKKPGSETSLDLKHDLSSSLVLHPANINNLPWNLETDKLKSFLSQHTARLVPLDETYKLDFTGGLLGGGGAQSTSSGGGGNDDSGSYGSSEHQDYGSKEFGDFRDYGSTEYCLALSSRCEGNPNCQPQVSTCVDRMISSESSHDFGRSYGKNGGSDGGYTPESMTPKSNSATQRSRQASVSNSQNLPDITADLVRFVTSPASMTRLDLEKILMTLSMPDLLTLQTKVETKVNAIKMNKIFGVPSTAPLQDQRIELVLECIQRVLQAGCKLAQVGQYVPHPAIQVPARALSVPCKVVQGVQTLNTVKAPVPLPARPTISAMASKPMAAAPAKPAPAPAKHVGSHQPIYAPNQLPAFPEANRISNINGRKTWADKNYFYQEDKMHGTVERYRKSGREDHVGEFNYNTGIQTKLADPTKKLRR